MHIQCSSHYKAVQSFETSLTQGRITPLGIAHQVPQKSKFSSTLAKHFHPAKFFAFTVVLAPCNWSVTFYVAPNMVRTYSNSLLRRSALVSSFRRTTGE